MDKLDLLKDLKSVYRPTGDPMLVEPPELRTLMIDGAGDPNTSTEYAAAVEALYAVSYALKFAVKRSGAVDYKVMPLEGLWWADNMADFSVERKQDWSWTMMIVQPALVTPDLVERAVADVARKKDLEALPKLRYEAFTEGLSAQVMHVGPYSAEGPTVEKLHAFIADSDYALTGKHHEIYLGDPRRTAPDRLKTVIRQPVTKP